MSTGVYAIYVIAAADLYIIWTLFRIEIYFRFGTGVIIVLRFYLFIIFLFRKFKWVYFKVTVSFNGNRYSYALKTIRKQENKKDIKILTNYLTTLSENYTKITIFCV